MLVRFTLVHDTVSGQNHCNISEHVFFSGLRLKQAAEQLLPASSSDSESEGGTDHVSGEFPASARQKVQVADSDGSSGEYSHRKHKRRREHSKQRKHKKSRYKLGSICSSCVPVQAKRILRVICVYNAHTCGLQCSA